MKLEINVDETMFKDILEKELKAFSEEELHEILRGCITEFFKNSDDLKKMFLSEKTEYWGGQSHFGGYEPTGLLKNIVRDNFKYDEPFKEVESALIEFCKKDGNLKEIMKGMIADAFQNSFNNCFWNNLDMRSSIANIVRQEIFGMKQTGQL